MSSSNCPPQERVGSQSSSDDTYEERFGAQSSSDSSDEEEGTSLSDVPVSKLLEEVVEALNLKKNEEWIKLLLESKDFTRYEQFNNYKRGGKPIGNLIDLLTRQNTGIDSKYPTALHLLATGELNNKLTLEKEKLSQLVGFLVRHRENLLGVQDNGGSTPLHDAIKNKKAELVDSICQAQSAEDIDSILSIKNHQQKNCLHIAVENEVPFLMSLVERAGPKTLSAKDDKGNTPLHLAVEYKHCKTNQLQVIQEIMKKCDSEIQATEELDDLSKNLMYNYDKMSPYSYHVSTTSNRQREKAEREDKPKRAGENGSSLTAVHNKSASKRSTPPILTAFEPLNPRSDADLVAKPPVRSNTQSFSKEEDISKMKPEMKQSRHQKSPGPKRTKESVQGIKMFLKLHYLRTRSHDVAYSIIHGRPPRIGNGKCCLK
ncbi:hypothetical protein NHQ30_005218 [Ciborinia camelliae]|nr:hypothetical protein NHQ30_005218 [Ciborinia camelliae]